MTSASSDFVLVAGERDLSRDADDLIRNDGTRMSPRALPATSPLRRERWSAAASAPRDGLSDYVAAEAQRVDLNRSAAFRAESASRAEAAARLCAALERAAPCDELRDILRNDAFANDDGVDDRGGVMQLLYAPLFDAFVGAETPAESELRRAEYTEKVFLPLSDVARAVEREMLRDIHRTAPNGFALLFADARVQKHLARLVLHSCLDGHAAGYLQGMCDIAAVVFLTFLEAAASALPPGPGDAVQRLSDVAMINAEADASRVVTALMRRFLPLFLDVLSGDELLRRMQLIELDLAVSNTELWLHLKRFGVELHLFMHRFNFTLLTRELSARACQRLFLAYLALPPHVDAVRVHAAVSVALLNVVYAHALSKTHDFESAVMTAQSAIAQRLPDAGLVLNAVFVEAERVMWARATVDRFVAVRASFLLLRGAAAAAHRSE